MMVKSIPILLLPFFMLGWIIPTYASEEHQGNTMKVGLAECDITPSIGMEMPGGYGKVFHQKLHDPCKVRAVVFDDGQSKVALVGVDALIVPRELVEAARKAIQEKCKIPPTAVMIGASHSHSSGPTGMVQPGQYDFASPLVKSLAYEKSSCANADYLETVRNAIVTAVSQADENRVESRCGVGVGNEDKAAFNRRFQMKNGLVFTHPGKGNPDIVEVAGPTDPQVGVIGAWNADGKLIGCVVQYTCHATTSPDGISANWIYYMEKTIRSYFGNDAIVVFLQGFSGDVTQVDNLSPYAERPGEDSARFVGTRVGAEAVKVLVGMVPGTLTPLDARSKVVTFSRRMPDPQRVKQCVETVQKDPKDVGTTEWTFAKEIVLLDALISKEPTEKAELQAVQIGPAVFLSAPGEMFCQLGLDLKAKSKFPFTFPVELANGCVGYIPTEEALGDHGGGYETRLSSYTNLEPQAGTIMVETLLDMASQMQIGEVPTPPKAPPFKEPWSYGNVPPELK